MNCPACGGDNREGASFCRHCGSLLTAPPVSETPVAEESARLPLAETGQSQRHQGKGGGFQEFAARPCLRHRPCLLSTTILLRLLSAFGRCPPAAGTASPSPLCRRRRSISRGYRLPVDYRVPYGRGPAVGLMGSASLRADTVVSSVALPPIIEPFSEAFQTRSSVISISGVITSMGPTVWW